MAIPARADGPVTAGMHDDHVAIATLHRPARLNALDGHTLETLGAIVADVAADAATRVLIICSSNPRAFCAGADLAWLGAAENDAARAERAALGHATMDAVASCPSLVIAAVEGMALGGGCELALACDLRIASATAKFGQPEVALGLFPGWGGTQRLTRLVGPAVALEMVLSGDAIDAERAHQVGLANRVEPGGQALEAALELAKHVASRPKGALTAAKSLIHAGLSLPLAPALALERDAFAASLDTPDAREGIDAFLNKRTPRFTSLP
jgi:enoyl-CoA hydratase